jgi:hypothetical protein
MRCNCANTAVNMSTGVDMRRYVSTAWFGVLRAVTSDS